MTRMAPEKLITGIADRLETCDAPEAQYLVARQLCESLYIITLALPPHITSSDMGLDAFITSKLLETSYAIAKPDVTHMDTGLRYRFKHFRELFMDAGETMEILDTVPLEDVTDFNQALVIALGRIFENPDVVAAIAEVIPAERIVECLETSFKALQPLEEW